MHLRSISAALAIIVMVGCGGGSGNSENTEIVGTFRATVVPYLSQDLWTGPECYDASVFLTVPAIYACRTKNAEMLTAFRDQFQRMLGTVTELPSPFDLYRIQYTYFLAKYIGEAKRAGQEWAIPSGLPEFVGREFSRLWDETPAWQWDAAPFPGGVEEKMTWKLAQGPTSRSYYRAINDDEMFTVATAGDLLDYARRTGTLVTLVPKLEAAVTLGIQAVQVRGEKTSEGGWLFNRGLWEQHSDYAYSAYSSAPETSDPPLARSNVAEDQSHSNRWGAWLQSLEYGTASPHLAADMRDVRNRLSWQILNRVLLPPTESVQVRFTNYMDGWNGVYRWNYVTQGPGKGYGPSELSGTPFIGWWGIIGTPGMRNLCASMALQFPLSGDEEQLYSYETTRYRNPLITDPSSYRNGFRWMLCAMGARL